jgi:hypothetical protein
VNKIVGKKAFNMQPGNYISNKNVYINNKRNEYQTPTNNFSNGFPTNNKNLNNKSNFNCVSNANINRMTNNSTNSNNFNKNQYYNNRSNIQNIQNTPNPNDNYGCYE